MSIPSFSSRPIPSMFMHCQGLVNLWPWTAYCLITWFFSVCSWEERISHCLQLSLVSKLLSTYIAGHCPPSLCCVKVWWLSDYEQQRVQNIKRQQDLETSLKSSLNWIAVTLELHSFRCSDEEYIDIFICSPQKPLKRNHSKVVFRPLLRTKRVFSQLAQNHWVHRWSFSDNSCPFPGHVISLIVSAVFLWFFIKCVRLRQV